MRHGKEIMEIEKKKLLTVKDVKEVLGVSESMAYKIIKELNDQMKAKGYYTITGRVSTKYFEECFYGIEKAKEVV